MALSGEVRHHQHELLSTVAPQRVVTPDMKRKSPGHLTQHRITCLMPVSVVQCFEKIDVSQHQACRMAFTPSAFQFMFQNFQNCCAVPQARESVVCRLLPGSLLYIQKLLSLALESGLAHP